MKIVVLVNTFLALYSKSPVIDKKRRGFLLPSLRGVKTHRLCDPAEAGLLCHCEEGRRSNPIKFIVFASISVANAEEMRGNPVK